MRVPEELGLLEEIPVAVRGLLIALLHPFAWAISQTICLLLQLGVMVAKEMYWTEERMGQSP